MNRVAIVLAAGSSRRFGGDKLSAEFRGEPLLHHAIRAARAAPVERVIVVAKPGLDIDAWDGATPVETVRIESGALSESLKAGIAAAGDCNGAFVFLGDMPLVPRDMAAMLAAQIGDAFAAQPTFEGKPGHPVLLSSRAIAAAQALEGDEGLGRILRARDDVLLVPCADPHILLDIDRPTDLAKIEAGGEDMQ
ncbi:MAG: nucleotidyltransferase family protein [Sphingomonadaceae bacterium]|jgi:molybdenum cofactor cytidylyltransferase